jgi:hypothetical protein
MAEEENADPKTIVSSTVFRTKIMEGLSAEDAERIAQEVGKDRYNNWDRKLLRWIKGHILAASAWLTTLIIAIGALLHERILALLRALLGA